MRRIAWIFLAGLLSTALPVRGESPPSPSLLAKCNAARLELTFGRIVVIPLHAGQLRVNSPESAPVHESLVVNNAPSSPMFRYERRDSEQSLVLEILNHRQISVRSESTDGKTLRVAEYRQPERGNVELLVQDGDQTIQLSGHSVWHLMFADKAAGRKYLAPLFAAIRPEWRLAETAEQLESALFQGALSEPYVSRSHLTSLVKDLGSAEFRRRQAADDRLRSIGPAVLPFLDSLKTSSMTREQRARVQRIRESISGTAFDSSERTAQWLSDDEQIWFALLRHSDPQHRHLATIRLTSMRFGSLEFDPYGDESYRQEQLAQLQSRIIRR